MRLYTKPHAKVNLGLHVGALRPDGYHELETIFIPVYGLYDEMQFILGEGSNAVRLFQIFEDGGRREILSDNLVLSAYEALLPYGPPAVTIALEKRIPMGAGLGGGSSDAVSTLRALASRCHTQPTAEQLYDMALSLGSDCPFFLLQSTAHATSRGEILSPIENPVSGCHIVILSPPIHISTAWAFRALPPHQLPSHSLLEGIARPREQWNSLLTNSFQEAAVREYPLIADLLYLLRREGAFYAALTGSGSSLYGLFQEPPSVAEWTLPSAVSVSCSRLSY